MEVITATFQNGIFTPEQNVNLADGAKVTLRIEPASNSSGSAGGKFSPLIPDEPFESEEQSAPYDLPMPENGHKIEAIAGIELLPDPPIIFE